MAREFGPLGIHVAHVVIDGGIDGEKLNTAAPQLRIERGADGLLNIDAIAEAYWHLHGQHRSAWTHELDLRPFKERFQKPDQPTKKGEEHGTTKRKDCGVVVRDGRSQLSDACSGQAANLYL